MGVIRGFIQAHTYAEVERIKHKLSHAFSKTLSRILGHALRCSLSCPLSHSHTHALNLSHTSCTSRMEEKTYAKKGVGKVRERRTHKESKTKTLLETNDN